MAKKVVKKKKTVENERARSATKSGARDNLKQAYKNNQKKAQKNKDRKVKSSWGEVSDKAQDTQKNRSATLASSTKSAQAAANKAQNKPKNVAKSSWGEVVNRTQTTGIQGKKNLNAKGGTADFINRNKNGGVNFNIGGKTVAQTSKKTDHSKEVEQRKSTGIHKNDSEGKAYSKGSNITKTGTVAEKKSLNLGNALQNGVVKAATTAVSYGSGEAGLTSALAKQAKADYKKYVKENGGKYDKETAKKWIRAYNAKDVEFDDGKTRADIDREMLRDSKKYGKAVADASAPKTLEYQDLTAQEHNIMQNAAGMQGYIPKRDKKGKVVKDENGNLVMISRANQYMESQQKGLSEKVGSVTAAGAYTGKAATGFMQGSGMANVLQSGVGQYNDAAKAALTKTQNSTAFNVGYGAGIMGQFMVGGIGSIGESLGEGAAKLAMNGSKGLLGKAANISQKNMATKFLTNRAGELLVESPLNFGDAVKMATDADGNVDRNTLATYMKLNSAMTFGMGGAIEGIGLGVAKSQVKQFERLYAKKAAGYALSDADEIKLAELGEKINEASNRIGLAKSRMADKTRYNVKVGQLLENVTGQKLTLKEVDEYLAKDTIHSERMATAEGLRDASLKELDDLRTERLKLLDDPVKNADEIKNVEARMKEAESNADLAARQLQIEVRRNQHTLKDLNNSLSKMEKATGIKYDVMDNNGMLELAQKYSKEQVGEDDFIKGFIYKDENGETRIAINSESPQAHQTVIGHETGHFLKDVDPEEFKAIGDMVINYAKKLGEYEPLVKDMRKWYPDAKPDELIEELRCELIGRYVYGGDNAFIKRLAGEKPSVMRRIIDYFKELLGKTTDKDLAKDLRAITERLENATKNLGSKAKSSDAEARMSKIGEQSSALTAQQTRQKGVAGILRNSGFDNDVIKKITNGWYFGKDGLPRLEISDANASVNISLLKRRIGKGETRLFDVLSHDDIYRHYPELKNVPVISDSSIKAGKMENGKIYVNPNRPYDDVRTTVIHELQHKIQDIEGFTRGSTANRWKGVQSEIAKRVDDVLKDLNAAGITLNKNELKRINNSNPKGVKDYVADKVKTLHGAKAANETLEFFKDAENLGYDLYDKILGKSEWAETPIENYYRTGGEAEAFDTADKINWTQKQIDSANAPDYSKDDLLLDPNQYRKYESVDNNNNTQYNTSGGKTNEGRNTAGLGEKTVRRGAEEVSREDSAGNGALGSKGIQEAPTSRKNKSDVQEELEKPSKGGSFIDDVERAWEEQEVADVDKELQADIKHKNLIKHITDSNGDITRTADMEYGDAVKRGDMQTAQEYVDAALEAKGYKYDAYHGSDTFGFTEFDLGKMDDGVSIFASSDKGIAASYTKNSKVTAIKDANEVDGGVYHGKIKMDNPLVVEAMGADFNRIPNDFKPTAKEQKGTSTTREITQYAKDNGYDGVIFKDLYDSGKYASAHNDVNTWGRSDIYCIFKSEQFKSADPVVRDNNGNIVPLSERGNETKRDFRFSRQRRDGTPKLSHLIDDVTKDSRFAGDPQEFAKDIDELAELIRNGKDVSAKIDGIRDKYIKIDEYEMTGEGVDPNVKSIIKSAPISLAELGDGSIAHKLENIGLSKDDVPSWVQLRTNRQGARGGKRFTSLDSVYSELSEDRPDLFPPDASSEDKLLNIINAAKQQPERARKPQEWIDGEANDLALDILDRVAEAVDAEKTAAKPANKYAAKATDEAHQKAGVSQEDVAKISDEDIGSEISYLNARIRNGKTPESQALREERLGELYAEAEKRGIDIRNSPRKRATEANNLIKNKGIGWEEAKTLKKEIEDLKSKHSALEAKIKAGGDDVEEMVAEAKTLANDLQKKRERLDKVIKNSKPTTKEGEDAYEAMQKRGLGNKPSRMDKTKWHDYKESLPEQESVVHDLWTTARRLFENSHVAFENQAKAVARTNRKLGNDMLAQINNVIVSRNIAAAWVETARTNAKGIINGKSLNDVFTVNYKGKQVDLRKNDELRNDLSNYLYLKHSIAREKVDKAVFGEDFTMADVYAAMESLETKYGKKLLNDFSKDVKDYIKGLNDFRLDTGLINAEQLAKWNDMYPDYVPTYRAGKQTINTYDLPDTKASIDNGIKFAKGSDEEIEDLYLQLAKMTDKTIKSGHQNKMVKMYAESMGIKPKDIPKDASLEDIAKSQIVAGRDKDGSWTVSYYKDGEHVTIPVDKQIAKGLREWNVQDKRAFIQLMSYGQKVTMPYKALITDLNLVFGVRNGMRDAQQALVNSKDSAWYARSIPAATSAVRHKDNAFRLLYDANGGKWSSIAQLSKLDDIAKINKGLIKGSIEKGIDKIEAINGAIEMMPRMSEFIGTITKEADKILKSKGSSLDKFKAGLEEELRKTHPNMESGNFTDLVEKEYAERIVNMINEAGGTDNIVALAMRNASDITVNFSRNGIITKGLNIGLVPYLNPSVQGLSKTMRMFSEGKANEALLNFMFKMTLLTTAPAVMNEILCKDNEAYQRLNTRDKDANFLIPLSIFGGDKDTFIKFPKPRENSVLAEPAEYFARFLIDKTQYGTPEEFKQMFVSAQENVGIINIWEDNLLSPLWKTAKNETWYGGDIESHADMYDADGNLKKPSERYDESTSPVAIWIGQHIGKATENAPDAIKNSKFVQGVGTLSPKKIDNLMDSYLGMIYDLGISQTSQKQRTNLKGNPLKNNPVFAQFLKDSVFSNKTATQFWDKVRKTSNQYGEQSQEYKEYMSKYGYDSFTYDDAITHVDSMKGLTDKQKVDMKRELRTMKNQLMQRALDGKPIKYDPMQRIINLYDRYGVKNATDKALSTFAYGDHLEAYEHLKSSKVYRDASPEEQKKWQQRFLNVYKDVKSIQRKTGGSDSYVDYSAAVFACVKNGYDKGHIANMYCWKQKDYSVEKQIERTKNYLDAGYTEKNFVVTQRAINAGAAKLGKYPSELNDYDKAMILAEKGYRDGAYYITSQYLDKRMNAARCLTDGYPDGKWTDKKIDKFCQEYNIKYEKGYTWDLDQVEAAINDKYKNKTDEEKAAIFTVITGNMSENPFGEIGNYGHDNDSGLFGDEDEKGKGGRGRRGRRRGRGGGGGSGGKGMSWDEWLKSQGLGQSTARKHGSGVSNNASKSLLNEAYRKKLQKNIKATSK